MKLSHGLVMVLVIVAAYVAGAMYPGLYTKFRGMV